MLLFSGNGDANIALPYTVMGVIVLSVALIFFRIRLPEINHDDCEDTTAEAKAGLKGLWKHRCFTWMDAHDAAIVLSFGGLGLFMIGRIIGSWIMSYIRAEKVLFICAIFTVLGALFVTLNLGTLSKGALFACYIFEAIMFPTIFAISLRGLGDYTKRASSFLMMSPIGGAVGPLLMGYVADISTMSFSFVVPLFGYAVVLIYSYMVMAKKLR